MLIITFFIALIKLILIFENNLLVLILLKVYICMGILSLIIGKAMNYTEQILTGTAGFIMATAAGIVGWWVKRGMASSDGKAKTTRVKHTEPCDAHIKFEKAMEKTIDELKESIRAIDHRLENSDLVQLQIMKQQMEMMKAIGDIKESVAFMATERGMKKSDINTN